ncbi:MAG: ATP-binding cassette domain-containing protein [Desulfuromonadales bacterium]|jgi:phospholipid/cholesterol/gamma-HCH transport system ATP-binding protein
MNAESTTPPVVIELTGVEKSFGRQTVLRGVDLQVRKGRTLVIVGASGQGKSVIIKHMLGLVTPDRGTVRVFDQDLKRLKRNDMDDVREKFGVLFQNAALFDSMNVYDNVALPLRERTRMEPAAVHDAVLEKLSLMGLEEAVDKFPAQLSGGMRKRVGLARALMLKPEIVFFDEPTTGLDVHKSNELYRLFYQTQQQLGYTAVIVSHDVPKIFKLADEVALLAEGRIQGCLTPEEFQLSDQPMIRSFVEETMGHLYTSDSEENGFYAQVQS